MYIPRHWDLVTGLIFSDFSKKFVTCIFRASLRNHVYILYTKIVQDVCNWCVQNGCKIDTKCIYPTFRQIFVYNLYTKLKELWQLNCIQNVSKSLSKCQIHLVTSCLHFVYCNSDLQKVY